MSNSEQIPDQEQRVIPQITEKQARRINAPARNMFISMAVMVALLVPILLLMPNLTNTKNYYDPQVDVPLIAYQAGQEAGYPVASPLPEGWSYNFARWRSNQADGIDYWNTGVVSPRQQYLELVQAAETNPTWIAQKTNNGAIIGQSVVEGVTWEVREYTDKDDKTTVYYVGEIAGTTVILMGDSDPSVFEEFAAAVVNYSDSPTHTVEPSPTGTSGIQ